VILKKKFDQSPLMCFMGRGVIDLPLNEIAADIFRVELSRYWNKFEVNSRRVKVLSESENHEDHIRYSCHESTRCLVPTKRDFVVYVHSAYVVSQGCVTYSTVLLCWLC